MSKPHISVKAYRGEKVESLYRRFKRKLKHENFILEIRKSDYFIKPSEKRRQKKRRRKFTDGTTIKKK